MEKRAETNANAKKTTSNSESNTVLFCPDLVKYDLSNPDEAAKAKQEKVFKKACANPIKSAIENFLKSKNMVFLFAGNRQKRFNSLPLFN